MIELLEKIRASLPEEVGRAKVIAKDHERMMRVAQEKAQAIVDEAASKHEELVGENEIVQRARAERRRGLARGRGTRARDS